MAYEMVVDNVCGLIDTFADSVLLQMRNVIRRIRLFIKSQIMYSFDDRLYGVAKFISASATSIAEFFRTLGSRYN